MFTVLIIQHTTYGNAGSSSNSIKGDSERDFFVELWDVSGHDRYKDCRSLFYTQINGKYLVSFPYKHIYFWINNCVLIINKWSFKWHMFPTFWYILVWYWIWYILVWDWPCLCILLCLNILVSNGINGLRTIAEVLVGLFRSLLMLWYQESAHSLIWLNKIPHRRNPLKPSVNTLLDYRDINILL